jgi:glycosyltransferase involved in cell wall biosynthesis
MKRLLILDPAHSTSEHVGHYASYNEMIAQAFSENSYTVEIIGKDSGVFLNDIWGVNQVTGKKVPFEKANTNFYTGVKSFLELNGTFDYIFVPNATTYTLDGLSGLIRDSVIEVPVIALARYESWMLESQLSDSQKGLLRSLILSRKLSLISDSFVLSKEISRIFRLIEVPYIDIPLKHLDLTDFSEAPKEFKVDTFGNARADKGFDLVIAAIEILKNYATDHSIKFRIQVSNPDTENTINGITRLLKRNSNLIEIINEFERPDKYQARMESSNCILLPYDQNIYKGRTSGVLIEALTLGIPTVVTKDSWLSIQTEPFNLGVRIPPDAESLAAAIVEVHQNYMLYKYRSLANRNVFKSRNSLQKVFEKLKDIFDSLERKRIWLFYEWSASSLLEYGAGSRVMSIYNSLKSNGYYPVIISPNWGSSLEIDSFLDITKPAKNIQIYQLDFNFHSHSVRQLQIHYGQFTQKSEELIRSHVLNDDETILFGTSFYKPLSAALVESDYKRWIIESPDFLKSKNRRTNEILLEMQLNALSNCTPYSISKSEADEFSKLGIPCLWSEPVSRSLSEENLADSALELVKQLVGLDKKIFLFVGSDWIPNIEALKFLEEIAYKYPNERYSILVAGKVAPPFRKRNLVSIGFVELEVLNVLYQIADAVLIPLFEGNGVSVKLLEALSFRKRIISTTVGARGTLNLDESQVTIVDIDKKQAKEFAEILELVSLEVPQVFQFQKKKDRIIIDNFPSLSLGEDVSGVNQFSNSNFLDFMIAFDKSDGEEIHKYLKEMELSSLDLVGLIKLDYVLRKYHLASNKSLGNLLVAQSYKGSVEEFISDPQPIVEVGNLWSEILFKYLQLFGQSKSVNSDQAEYVNEIVKRAELFQVFSRNTTNIKINEVTSSLPPEYITLAEISVKIFRRFSRKGYDRLSVCVKNNSSLYRFLVTKKVKRNSKLIRIILSLRSN